MKIVRGVKIEPATKYSDPKSLWCDNQDVIEARIEGTAILEEHCNHSDIKLLEQAYITGSAVLTAKVDANDLYNDIMCNDDFEYFFV